MRCARAIFLLGTHFFASSALAQGPAADEARALEGPCPASLTTLTQAIEEADRAFVDMDGEAFDDARVQVLESLACLNAPLTPRVAAELHRHAALAAFSELDPDTAVPSLQALLRIQPYFHFSPTLAPSEDHPLNLLVDQAQEASMGTPLTVRMPRGAVLRIDGERAEERQSALPAAAQVLTDQGEVLWSGYVLPQDPLPPANLPALPRSPKQPLSRSLIVGGSVLLVGGGATLAAGFANNNAFRDLSVRVAQGDTSLDT